MKTTRLRSHACALCGHKIDAVTPGPESPGATPKPGDGSICIHCGGVLIFDEHLKLRPATAEELTEIMAIPEAVAMIRAIDILRPPPRA